MQGRNGRWLTKGRYVLFVLLFHLLTITFRHFFEHHGCERAQTFFAQPFLLIEGTIPAGVGEVPVESWGGVTIVNFLASTLFY